MDASEAAVDTTMAEVESGLLALAVQQLDQSIQCHADPEIHDQAKIQPVRTVSGGGRQMGHYDEKVEQVAAHDGNRLLDESAAYRG
jgi:hypothetical protein